MVARARSSDAVRQTGCPEFCRCIAAGSHYGTELRAGGTSFGRWIRGANALVVLAVGVGCTAPAKKLEAPKALPASSIAPASPDSTPSMDWPLGPAPSPDDLAAQVTRLSKASGTVKSNWVPPGKHDRYGHAEALIPAPYDTVRGRLVDYAHFKDLAGPKFSTVRVVGKENRATDVYFILPIMKGLLRLWYVTRFAPPREGQGGEVFEGSFVKGNIKGMHIVFSLRRGNGDEMSLLSCDLLLSLSIPAPQDNVDEELRDACGDALEAVRRGVTVVAAP